MDRLQPLSQAATPVGNYRDVKEETLEGTLSAIVWRDDATGFGPPERESVCKATVTILSDRNRASRRRHGPVNAANRTQV